MEKPHLLKRKMGTYQNRMGSCCRRDTRQRRKVHLSGKEGALVKVKRESLRFSLFFSFLFFFHKLGSLSLNQQLVYTIT